MDLSSPSDNTVSSSRPLRGLTFVHNLEEDLEEDILKYPLIVLMRRLSHCFLPSFWPPFFVLMRRLSHCFLPTFWPPGWVEAFIFY